MRPVHFLADTSALIRMLRDAKVHNDWHDTMAAGLVASCPITELELLFTAQSKADRVRQKKLLREIFSWVVMPERVYERAIDVQAALTDRGAHRSASPVDLLTAAAAETHRLVLLHYDRDFVQLSKVTGQPTQWLARPGHAN